MAIWATERAVRPLIFTTGVDEFPFGARGTAFLVGEVESGVNHAFAVTARHSLDVERFGVPNLCIVSDDGATSLLPLKRGHFLPQSQVEDQWADVTAIELDWPQIPTWVMRLEPLIVPRHVWTKAPHFFIVGFPDHRSDADADKRILTLERVALEGTYAGQSELKGLHKLHIRDADLHPSFSGWSGSPVLALLPMPNEPPRMALCGVAVAGAPSSGVVHFTDVQWMLILMHRALHPNIPFPPPA